MSHKDKKIEFICKKAYEKLLQNGIHNFSLNKFILELEMSKGQFYYYFKTKEELICKTIDTKSYEVFNYTYQQTKSKSTFLEKMFAFFAFFLEESDSKFADFDTLLKSTFHLYMNRDNEKIQKMNQDFNDLLLEQLNDIFDAMIESGYLKEEAKSFPRTLIATADGMYIHSLMDNSYDIKSYFSDYLIMIDKLLKKGNDGVEK